MLEAALWPRAAGRLSVVLRARTGSLTRTAPRTRDCCPPPWGSTQGRLFDSIAVLRGGASWPALESAVAQLTLPRCSHERWGLGVFCAPSVVVFRAVSSGS